jgi:transcriptional regulator with XRE-family HTH domain
MDKTRREIEVELGSLIRNARKALGLTQGEVAELVGDLADKRLTQGKVSAHEGGTWGRGAIEDFIGAYGRALRIPEESLRAALGYMPPGWTPPPPSFEETVLADASLDDESKEHIIRQYALLQAATRHNRGQASAS